MKDIQISHKVIKKEKKQRIHKTIAQDDEIVISEIHLPKYHILHFTPFNKSLLFYHILDGKLSDLHPTSPKELVQNDHFYVSHFETYKTYMATEPTVLLSVGKRNIVEKSESQLNSVYKTLYELNRLDSYSYLHAMRVYYITVLMVLNLGIEGFEQHRIIDAAMFYDLGKHKLSKELLTKPNAYSDEDFEEMRSHAGHGYVLMKEHNLHDIADIVKHHHEAFDGSGYPDKLKGYDIPLGSRIISIADTYDALVNERPHKSAKTHSMALKTIQNNSNKQFDPDICELFIRLHYRGFIEDIYNMFD
jgi:HD-GYP domain-containing protein (c-di-GMP phosphodiesterase class II)